MTIGDQYRQKQHRVGGLALLDLVPTVLVAVGIAYYHDKSFNLGTILIVLMILIVIAIITHVAIGQPTMLNYYLGISRKPDIMAV